MTFEIVVTIAIVWDLVPIEEARREKMTRD